MAIAVILMLSGADSAGFALGLIVVGIAAVLLGSMFVDEAVRGANRRSTRRPRYRGTHIAGH